MNKNTKWTVGLLVCALIVIAAVVLSMGGVFSSLGLSYANAEKYAAGGASVSGEIRNLDIHWVNGKVNLEYHGGKTVELRETSNKPIGEDLKMRWWLDGDTLRVQYAKSGFRLTWNQEKELTLSLPEGMTFDKVNIEATSGDLHIPALLAETVALNVTSGNITAAAAAQTLSVGATSGDISLRVPGSTQALTVGTTSGNISVEAEQADTVMASSTSGGIGISARQVRDCDAGSTSGSVYVVLGAAQRVKLGSTSGNIRVALESFADLEVGTTSGSVIASLPDQPGFSAKLETASGSVDYSLPLSRQGSLYVCGDGSGKVKIGTTSGNIQLNAKE